MDGSGHILALLMLIVGILVFLAILLKALLRRYQLPALVAFVVLGFGLRLGREFSGLAIGDGEGVLEFLSYVGVTCLLFRVGLDSDLGALLRRLRSALVIWVGNVALSLGAGYLTGHYLLGLAAGPSMFLAVALTATSVGVSVAIWRDRGALQSETGELLIDIAELDDLSGVVMMALLFALVPVLSGAAGDVVPVLVLTLGLVVFKLVAFGGMCFLFSRYVEEPMTDFCRSLEHGPDPMISMVAVALVIAAVAGLLGFSVAIGAFFAGLVFSRDPDAVRMEASFEPLYEFFTPFFFIHIGYLIVPGSLGAAFGVGALVLVVAVVVKVVGTWVPALLTVDARTAAVLGISVVPRAEIALIVMQRGTTMAGADVPSAVYSAMVIVSAATCLGTPLVLSGLFRRWPQVIGGRD